MRTVLFFDLDGTLVRNAFRDTLLPNLSAALGAAAGEPPDLVLRRILDEWARRDRDEPDPVRGMDWDDIAAGVARELGVPCPHSLEAECVAHAQPPYVATLDASRAVLAALRRPWRRLVVASRGLGKYQRPMLRGLGLADLFDAVLLPDTTGLAKADPRFFAAEAANADLAVHTGDLYLDDVYYPTRAGVLTVWKRTLDAAEAAIADPLARAARATLPNGYTVRPTALIASLVELPPVVDRLEEQADA